MPRWDGFTAAERLAAGLVRKPNGCLEWTGTTDKDGYGRFQVNGKTTRTHRVAWTLANGPIPDGLHVLHHCDNPPCGETEPTEGYPEGHLFLGTVADNMADKIAKGREGVNAQAAKTHCKNGHAFDEANTYVTPKGKRSCRACSNAASARYLQRKWLSVAS